jgi:hypothetical protein
MSLKDLLLKALPFVRRKESKESPPEIPLSKEPVSPYAKLLEAEVEAALIVTSTPKPRDVFMLDNLTAKPKSTVGLLFENPGVVVIRDPYRGSVGRLMPWRLEGKSFALYGDWFGTGTEAIGFFHRPSRYFLLWRSDTVEQPEIEFPFGPPDSNWIPLVGDWDGDGVDGIGFYDPDRSVFMLRNALSAPALPEIEFQFGQAADQWLPISGDWNGDGKDGIGLFDPNTGTFYLRDELSSGVPQHKVRLGKGVPGCIPLAGDWNGDGVDGIGYYDGATGSFYLRNALKDGEAEISFRFGPHEVLGTPFSGRWMLPGAGTR